jgi:hypothetical protein
MRLNLGSPAPSMYPPCPLGLCDGSGFITVDGGEDEDNCGHVDPPPGGWTPEAVAAWKACYETAHRTGDPACPFCGPDGVWPGARA